MTELVEQRTTWHVGDIVEVKSLDEILATLDDQGELDGLPFMPEMVQYCGRRLEVGKVAHKVCDTISGSGMRRMTDAVHLSDVRCDGSAHGGCQAACLVYWKTRLGSTEWREIGLPGERCRAHRIGGRLAAVTLVDHAPCVSRRFAQVPLPGHRAVACCS